MLMKGELAIATGGLNDRVTARPSVWKRFAATITNRDLIAIVGFCAIGLLVTVCFGSLEQLP